MTRRNIASVVYDDLCTGCGACSNVCPLSAVRILKQNGGYFPEVNRDLCNPGKECGACYSICPGREIAIEEISASLFPEATADVMIGRYITCFTGHSLDHEIRYHSASGGVITGLLVWLLQTNAIQGAFVTRAQEHNPLEPKVILATTADEVKSARSSRYCPVSFIDIIKQVKDTNGVYAAVGLPCHIHAFRKMTEKIPWLRNRIAWHFGLFCSGNKSFHATDYLLSQMGIDTSQVCSFAYRDDGCLGSMKVNLRNGKVLTRSYKEYYPSLRSFFHPHRCTLCHDQCAELADISFGDIHIPEYWDDSIGTSSLIARSERAEQLLQEAKMACVIHVAPLDKTLLGKSQAFMLKRKKAQIQTRMRMMKFVGKKVPNYDVAFQKLSRMETLKTILSSIILYFEIGIGKRKCLWWMIGKLNRCAHFLGK